MRQPFLLPALFASIGIACICTAEPAPPEAWVTDLGACVAAPALVDGERIYVGDDAGKLTCLRLDDGSIAWQVALEGGSIRSKPALAGGRVVINTAGGIVHALDTATGKPAWTFRTGGETPLDIWDYNTSGAATDGTTFYLGSTDKHVYALNVDTGAVQWQREVPGPVRAPLAIDGDRIYVGTLSGHILALSPADGQELWRMKTVGEAPYFDTGEVLFEPQVADGIVVLGCRDFRFYGLVPDSGRIKWMLWSQGWTTSTLVDKGTAYGCTSDSSLVYAIEAQTGGLKWTAPCPINVFCKPAVTDDLLLVGALNGILYAYDRETGTQRWSYRTQGNRSHDGSILTPEGAWKQEVRDSFASYDNLKAAYEGLYQAGAILSAPTVADNKVVFASADGHVYALSLR